MSPPPSTTRLCVVGRRVLLLFRCPGNQDKGQSEKIKKKPSAVNGLSISAGVRMAFYRSGHSARRRRKMASATAPTASRKFINSVFIRREGMLRQEKTKVELLADWFGSLERCQTSVARPCSSPIDSERKGRITRMQIRPRLALPEINDPQVISAAPVVYFASAFHLLWLTRADFLGRCKSVADSSSPSLTTISRQTMKMVNAPMDSVGFRSACLVQKEAKFSGG